jgi:fucose permease
MNTIAVMVGLGGLALPLAVAGLSGLASWRMVVAGAGVLSASVGVACLRLPAAGLDTRAATSTLAAVRHFFRQPAFLWFCLLVLLGGGSEASLAGWITSYLELSGFNASTATWLLASHWLGLIVSRVLCAGRVETRKERAIVSSAALGGACVLLFAASSSTTLLAVLPFLIGMAMALVVPTALALAGDRFSGNGGTLFGALLTLAQIGGIVLPASVGFVAEAAGTRAGISLICASYAGIVVILLRLRRARPAGVR